MEEIVVAVDRREWLRKQEPRVSGETETVVPSMLKVEIRKYPKKKLFWNEKIDERAQTS